MISLHVLGGESSHSLQGSDDVEGVSGVGMRLSVKEPSVACFSTIVCCLPDLALGLI
jgi:hypothetical protein